MAARDRLVFVEFGARVEKSLRKDETGRPVLRMLASGTKLDATEYVDNGIHVVGEKIDRGLLESMRDQAAAGTVYLLESHPTTLTMGTSVGAEIMDAAEPGESELFVDFALDVENPLVGYLLKRLEAGDYTPQCSVGLMVRRVVEWDEEENGYVGRLMEGHFEHVALTRPRHAAYPDAKLEQVFLSGETFAEAWKSLIAATQQEIEDVEASAAAEEAAVQAEKSVHGDEAIATATRIVKADRDPTSIQTLIFDGDRFSVEEAKAWAKKNGFEAGKVDQTEGGSIRLRQREPGEFKPDSFRTIALTDGVKAVVGRPKGNEAEKTANSREGEIEMEVKVRKTDPAKVTVEKEADAAKKESESEAKKESESESKKEDAKKESESEDTKEDAKKGDPPPPPKKDEGDGKDEDEDDKPDPDAKKGGGVSLRALSDHLKEMAEMAKGADDASGEDLRELMADMAADLERACEIANEMVGAGGEEKEDAKKESESEDTKEDAKKEDAKKESEDEDAGMVVKGIERSLRRIGRSLAGFEKRQKAVEDQLGILAKQPATSGAVRFNDGSVVNGGKGEEKGGALDGAVEILKGITDPKEKDLLSRQLAAKILSGVFEGGASGKTS